MARIFRRGVRHSNRQNGRRAQGSKPWPQGFLLCAQGLGALHARLFSLRAKLFSLRAELFSLRATRRNSARKALKLARKAPELGPQGFLLGRPSF
jgi:hypothetical protein